MRSNDPKVRPVSAYFMHDHEEVAARKLAAEGKIQDPEWSQGKVFGWIDPQNIKLLQSVGLVVTYQD